MNSIKQKIPEGWSVKKLGELGDFSKGSGITKNDLVSVGLPCVRYAELYTKYNFVISECVSFISRDISKIAKPIQQGDILFAGSGETKEEIGRCAVYNNPVPAYAGGDNIIFRPQEDNSIFLSYFLNTIGRRYLNRLGQGDSIVHIHSENLKKIYISLPPLVEQEKIAEILGTWDDGIEKLSALIEQKKLQKKGLMQKLLTSKHRLKGFTEPWKEVKLGELGTISSAGVDKKIVAGERLVELLNYMDVYKKDFLYKDDTSMVVSAPERQIINCNLKKGDIFFTPSSETRDDIAHSAVIMEDIDNGVYSYHVVRLRPFIQIDLKFSAYAFKADKFYKQAYAWCAGSGQRYVLSQDDFRNMKVYIPTDVAEQKVIAGILSVADEEIDILNKKLEALKEQKKGLMQQLLTGKIRVKVN